MKLELNLPEINIILQALGNAPYAQVFELVQRIRDQVQPQVTASEQAAEDVTDVGV